MNTRQTLAALGFVMLVTLVAPPVLRAPPMNDQGTVLAIQPARVQVRTIDEKTKKEAVVWFVVDKNTKVKRGGKTVTYADAKISVNERIVVIVDMDARTKMLAEEIRLAARP